MRSMQPGISSFAFGWAFSPEARGIGRAMSAMDLLDFARGHGAEVVQYGDNVPLSEFTNDQLAAIAARAREFGLRIETGARGLTTARLHRYIAVSEQLDSRLLRFVIDAAHYEPPEDQVTKVIREALPALTATGLILGLENHDRFSCATLRAIVDRLGSSHVGICLDTANSLGNGEGLDTVLQYLAPVCVNLHLKDFAVTRVPSQMGFTVSGRVLGQGLLPARQVLETVSRGGRCATAVIELWTQPETDFPATIDKERRGAEASLTYLRTLLSFGHD